MAGNPTAEARAILEAIQAAVDARDVDALASLFDEPAVLIGTAGDGRDPDAIRAYLTAVVIQPESLRWEWREIVPFHDGADALGFAAFGEVVLSGETRESSAPIRLTIFAVREADGWKLRQFHGSIPAGV